MSTQNKRLKVLHYVWWNNAHVREIVRDMQQLGIDARQSKAVIPTSIARIILSPLYPLGYRLLGYRIVHLHWIAGHFRPSTSRSMLMSYVYNIWYKLFLLMAKISGLKIVWTAHNVTPHDRIFPNDEKARQFLIQHCDLVFALNQTSKTLLESEFNGTNVLLIPVAEVIPKPTESREETRKALGVGNDEVLYSHLGHIRPYKGTDRFLQAMNDEQQGVKYLICGAPGPIKFMEYIHSLRNQAIAKGADLIYREEFVSDAELANLIQASDFLVCPFEKINNSGFVNLAFATGTPLILSDIPGLSWVPRDAVIWIEPQNDIASLLHTISQALKLSGEELLSMVSQGQRFADGHEWSDYVQAQTQAYKSLFQ